MVRFECRDSRIESAEGMCTGIESHVGGQWTVRSYMGRHLDRRDQAIAAPVGLVESESCVGNLRKQRERAPVIENYCAQRESTLARVRLWLGRELGRQEGETIPRNQHGPRFLKPRSRTPIP